MEVQHSVSDNSQPELNQLAEQDAAQQAEHVQHLQAAQALGRGVSDEVINLQERVDPAVPGPLPTTQEDSMGWGEIDKLGVWDCVLSTFSAIEEVPAQHREAWAMAMDRAHRMIWESQEHGVDLDRALKWWFFLPQALCRKAQRGGRQG